MTKRDELLALADDIDRRGWKALVDISASSKTMALIAAEIERLDRLANTGRR